MLFRSGRPAVAQPRDRSRSPPLFAGLTVENDDDMAGITELRVFWCTRDVDNQSAARWNNSPKNAKRKKNLEKRGKVLKYAKEDATVRAGLDQTRRVEWTKWKKYSAVQIISASKADELLAQGAEQIGTQWVETDKNEVLRVEGAEDIEPKYKSRLVALGNNEKAEIRSDSPTAENEALNLVNSFGASRRLPVRSGDRKSVV